MHYSGRPAADVGRTLPRCAPTEAVARLKDDQCAKTNQHTNQTQQTINKINHREFSNKKSIYEMMNSVVSAVVGNRFNRDGQPETRSSQLELSENEDN